MSYHFFVEKLKAKIKKERDGQVEELAEGYGADDYDFRVGRLRGYADALTFAQAVLREMHDGED